MALNTKLKAARVLRSMTQLQLAGKVGLKEIDVSRFETGRSWPNSEMKKRIAEVLGQATQDLFDR